MKFPSIDFNKEKLGFEEAVKREWLVTNGLGGYCSSTVLGLNTRKYHGLLVAALDPPKDRRVFLTKLDEDISFGNHVFRLGTNEFQDGLFPKGYSFLSKFSVSPFPEFIYSLPNVTIRKKVFMPYGKNASISLYDVSNDNGFDISIQVFPIVNGRDFHSVTDRGKTSIEFAQKQRHLGTEIQAKPAEPVLMIITTEGKYVATGKWVERVFLREEVARGESYLDDCYQPGYFEVELKAKTGKEFAITAAVDADEAEAEKLMADLPSSTQDIRDIYDAEMSRCENLLLGFYGTHRSIVSNSWLDWLVLNTGTFIVQGGGQGQKAVIAGYHWFGSWGRDTFISLPGLVLVPGRFEYAKKILLNFTDYCKQGLIPNFLPEKDAAPAYNTVDATLWFINATFQYLKYTRDLNSVKEKFWETLKSIVESHVKGTGFNIRVDTDGLLSHGPRLTWMDAAFNGRAFTPREGKAVEIQALWYNALKIMQLLGKAFEETTESEDYEAMAEKAKKSFCEQFWNAEKSCLYDVIGKNGKDGSMRPNQILAVALDFSVFDDSRAKRVVEAVQRELLTPYGLRTLSRNESGYVRFCTGDRESRDKAYHNGTVWPWLLGPFVTANLKTNGCDESKRESAHESFVMQLFSSIFSEGGLGTLNEIFDGDPPHTPRGCISQAWSVAEPLRAYVEDIMHVRPKYEDKLLMGSG